VIRCLVAVVALSLTNATAPAQWSWRSNNQLPAPRPVDNPLTIQLLSHHDWKDRARAADQLGATGDSSAIPALSRAVRMDPNPRVRQQAAQAIQMIRNQSGKLILQPPPNNLWSARWQQSPLQGDPGVELVTNWYQRFLNRAPDAEGLNFFINLLNNGSEEDALAAMLGSAEYLKLHGNNRGTFIQGLYSDILHRQGKLQEIRGWEEQLVNFGDDRQRLAEEFLRAAHTELNGLPW